MKIIANPFKEWALELKDYLEKNLELEKEITIVIGGDGTFLYNKENVEGIVILIGSETSKRAHINYCKDVKKEDVKEALEKIRDFSYYELPLYEANGFSFINDAVVHTNDHRVVYCEVKEKELLRASRGDGVIISTPFGSLGYNKSVGGPELDLNLNLLAISFISPLVYQIPLVVPFKELIVNVKGNADLVIDGEVKEKNVKEVRIKNTSKAIRFFKNKLKIK